MIGNVTVAKECVKHAFFVVNIITVQLKGLEFLDVLINYYLLLLIIILYYYILFASELLALTGWAYRHKLPEQVVVRYINILSVPGGWQGLRCVPVKVTVVTQSIPLFIFFSNSQSLKFKSVVYIHNYPKYSALASPPFHLRLSGPPIPTNCTVSNWGFHAFHIPAMGWLFCLPAKISLALVVPKFWGLFQGFLELNAISMLNHGW